MFDPHSHAMMGFKDDKGAAVLLCNQAQEWLLEYLYM